jgi:hypothetical protein
VSVPTVELADAIAAYLEQRDRHGHTPEADAERPIGRMGRLLYEHATLVRDTIETGPHQNLSVGYRRAARLAALAIATMQRIKAEEAKG